MELLFSEHTTLDFLGCVCVQQVGGVVQVGRTVNLELLS